MAGRLASTTLARTQGRWRPIPSRRGVAGGGGPPARGGGPRLPLGDRRADGAGRRPLGRVWLELARDRGGAGQLRLVGERPDRRRSCRRGDRARSGPVRDSSLGTRRPDRDGHEREPGAADSDPPRTRQLGGVRAGGRRALWDERRVLARPIPKPASRRRAAARPRVAAVERGEPRDLLLAGSPGEVLREAREDLARCDRRHRPQRAHRGRRPRLRRGVRLREVPPRLLPAARREGRLRSRRAASLRPDGGIRPPWDPRGTPSDETRARRADEGMGERDRLGLGAERPSPEQRPEGAGEGVAGVLSASCPPPPEASDLARRLVRLARPADGPERLLVVLQRRPARRRRQAEALAQGLQACELRSAAPTAPASASAACAALRPPSAITLPPGWVAAPHR